MYAEVLRHQIIGVEKAASNPATVAFSVVPKTYLRDLDVIQGQAIAVHRFVGDVLEAEQHFLPRVRGEIHGLLYPPRHAAVAALTGVTGAIAVP